MLWWWCRVDWSRQAMPFTAICAEPISLEYFCCLVQLILLNWMFRYRDHEFRNRVTSIHVLLVRVSPVSLSSQPGASKPTGMITHHVLYSVSRRIESDQCLSSSPPVCTVVISQWVLPVSINLSLTPSTTPPSLHLSTSPSLHLSTSPPLHLFLSTHSTKFSIYYDIELTYIIKP